MSSRGLSFILMTLVLLFASVCRNDDAAQRRTMYSMREIAAAVQELAIDIGRYPDSTNIEAVGQQVQPTYTQSITTRDSWGTEYKYLCTERDAVACITFAIISAGADRTFQHEHVHDYGTRHAITDPADDIVFTADIENGGMPREITGGFLTYPPPADTAPQPQDLAGDYGVAAESPVVFTLERPGRFRVHSAPDEVTKVLNSRGGGWTRQGKWDIFYVGDGWAIRLIYDDNSEYRRESALIVIRDGRRPELRAFSAGREITFARMKATS